MRDRGVLEIVGAGLVPARLVEPMGATIGGQPRGGQRHGGQPQGLPLQQYVAEGAAIMAADVRAGGTKLLEGTGLGGLQADPASSDAQGTGEVKATSPV